MKKSEIDKIFNELNSTFHMNPYDAFERCWILLVKISNTISSKPNEHKRMLDLLKILDEKEIKSILTNAGVRELMNLNPPLEHILYNKHEHLDKSKVINSFSIIKNHNEENMKEAIVALSEILKKIRNKRAHGFKAPNGPRDNQILSASTKIVRHMVGLIAENLLKLEDAG